MSNQTKLRRLCSLTLVALPCVSRHSLISYGGRHAMRRCAPAISPRWSTARRFDNVVYAIDTSTGEVKTIKVDREPHGLTVWPQPGRYSLGHTGNMR
jgi:hypothetical protein